MIHDFLHTFPISITSFCKQKCLFFTILLQYYVGIISHVFLSVNKKCKTLLIVQNNKRMKPAASPFCNISLFNLCKYLPDKIKEDVFLILHHPVHLNMPVQHQIQSYIPSALPDSCDMQLLHRQR